MQVLSHFVKKTIANVLYSRICAEERTTLLTATIQYNEGQPRKMLRLYPEVVKYQLKTYATDAGIAEYNASLLRYTQPALMFFPQCAHDLVAKSCKADNINGVSTLNDMFVKGVDTSTHHSLQDCCARHPHADFDQNRV